MIKFFVQAMQLVSEPLIPADEIRCVHVLAHFSAYKNLFSFLQEMKCLRYF